MLRPRPKPVAELSAPEPTPRAMEALCHTPTDWVSVWVGTWEGEWV